MSVKKLPKPDELTLGIGHTSFSLRLAHDYPHFANDKALEQFKKRNWQIQVGSNEMEILPYVKRTQCVFLYLIGKYQANEYLPILSISKLISHIDFTYLRTLSFYDFDIASFEGLAFLNMEFLEQLHAWQNQITSLKSLNKTNWPNLKYMHFSYDCCATRMDIGRTRSRKSMDILKIGSQNLVAHIEDLSRLVKFEPQQIKYVRLRFNFQDKILEQLRSRFSTRQIVRRRALNSNQI